MLNIFFWTLQCLGNLVLRKLSLLYIIIVNSGALSDLSNSHPAFLNPYSSQDLALCCAQMMAYVENTKT